MASSTVEDYLKCILLAQQEGQERVATGWIAQRLAVSPGTVTAMLKTLSDAELVGYEPYAGVALTPGGRQLASRVLRRHRLLELFLVEVVGLDWSEVHEEAEQLEHAVSERLIERIDAMLGHPSTDPHGDPIPDRRGQIAAETHADLLDCPTGTLLRVVRITDQNPDFLVLVQDHGLVPGECVEVLGRDETADVVHLRHRSGREITLGFRAASKIRLRPATESAPERGPSGGPDHKTSGGREVATKEPLRA